jgi:diaminobutyrate-2-oxoglutarate transaminase
MRRISNDVTGPVEYLSTVESSARTYAANFPRLFVHAKGMRVRDSEGQEYLDCLSNAGTLALGHNHPEVNEAVRGFLETDALQQALDLATPAKYEFVKELFGLLPRSLREHGRVQFCGPSGADAVEAAMKLTRHHSGRHDIFAFHGAYHGMTAGALSAMGNLGCKTGLSLSGVHFLPYPYTFRCPFGTDGSRTDELSLAYLHRVLSDPESGVARPAAVIVEVVQGEGGCIPASARWLRGLREITEQHDIALIVDEVQTGLGRTGHLFGIEHADVTPDVLVLSKAIGGGYPMSVVVYHERLDTWKAGMHAGTFRGNQIAMVAGRVTMEIIQRDRLALRAARLGESLQGALRRIAAEFPCIGEVRGRGLMIGVEIVRRDVAAAEAPADGALARAIKQQCFEQGLIVESGGRHGAVLRFLPPLTISESEMGAVVDRFGSALAAVLRESRTC